MKVQEAPLLPLNPESDFDARMYQQFTKMVREFGQKINLMASGATAGYDNQSTAVPSTGTWAIGDFVKKSNPVEAGSAASKYVIVGWIRVTDGTNNVLNTDWLECRFLTGN